MHIPDASTLPVNWRKSSHSAAQGDCVELAVPDAHSIAVRDSKNPTGPALLFTRKTMETFLAGLKAGTFDQ